VGPAPETLELFGNKAAAQALAARCGVATLPGTQQATSLVEAGDFLASLGAGGAVMVKVLAGGGGRGMRPVHEATELAAAFERCQSEAMQAFGNSDVYVARR
jgi:pyruvate carboxylase